MNDLNQWPMTSEEKTVRFLDDDDVVVVAAAAGTNEEVVADDDDVEANGINVD